MALSLAIHGLAIASLFVIAGTLGSTATLPVAAWAENPVRFHPR
jgi:hypothetical protein